AAQVFHDRRVDVDHVAGLRADRQLFHVEDRARVEHGAPLGHGEDRERVGHALGHQRGAVDRVDRDVDLGTGAVADVLAVEQHRGVVLLTLPDHDDATHRYRIDKSAHRVDRGAVAALLVAASDPTAGGHRGRFGDPYQVKGEVTVRFLWLTYGRDVRLG